MGSSKDKLVTNLLENISKARDILERGDFREIYRKVTLFSKIENDLRIQLGKFTKDKKYQLDFNYHDLEDLSEEIYNYIKHYPATFRTKYYLEDVAKIERLTVTELNTYSDRLAEKYTVDSYLRSCYMVASYFAMVVCVYSNSVERQDIFQKDYTMELTDHIRSFL